MKKILPMLFTATGGVLGSLYGYLTMLATVPALITSDIPVPSDFVVTYQSNYFYVVLPMSIVIGWWIGKWRGPQIGELIGWRRWVALTLLALIVTVLGYVASIALFFLSA